MATTGWSATARSPPPPPSENVMDTLFSYDNTIMLAAIISLLLVILFVLLLHLYARWFLSGHRHRLRPDHHPGPLQASSVVTTTYHISPPRSKEAGAMGLDSAAIHSIPTFSYEAAAAELECAVCLGEFEAGEVGRSLPRCSHCFHVECIDTWLVAHTTCPVCRLHVVVVQGGDRGLGAKEDGDRKDDDHSHNHSHDVILDILDDHDDVASDKEGSSSSSGGESSLSPENAAFERFMRVAASRSCRSDVVSVANHHPSERPRPSI